MLLPDLALTPDGRWFLIGLGDAPASKAKSIEVAFHASTASGVLALVAWPDPVGPAAAWVKSLALDLLGRLCHSPAESDGRPSLVEPRNLEAALLRAPPMRGGEYLALDTLRNLFDAVQAEVRARMKAHPEGAAVYLRQLHPSLHTLGRVSFHLAENPRNPDKPFAFMASYASGLSDNGKVRHQPLGQALKEFASVQGKPDQARLRQLLDPVYIAAQASPVAKKMLDAGTIFTPQAWGAADAYAFLKDVPQLEHAGLLVRIPDWWASRSRPKPQATVGAKAPSRLGLDALFSFDLGVALGDERLTEAELAALLKGQGGLVQFKGKWIEVDREKLAQALEHFKAVRRDNPDGIPLLKAMRMLAGMPEEAGAKVEDLPSPDWSQTVAGPWLADRLRGLREGAGQPLAKGLSATLRPYQETGVRWLAGMRQLGLGACLADDMGLGKTLQVIALLWQLKQDAKKGQAATPSLLIAPASLLPNWRAEAAKFAPDLRLHISHGAFDGVEEPSNLVDLVVTSYAQATRLPWLEKKSWNLLVLDESQAIKNPGTAQTKGVKKIKANTRIALTGTPIENQLGDLWSLMDFLNPGLLGSAKDFTQYAKALDRDTNPQAYAPLRHLVAPYLLRRLKTDKKIIADLPDKVLLKAHCTLSKKQAALYAEEVENLAKTLEQVDGIQRRGVVLASLMRLKQLCNHPDHLAGQPVGQENMRGKFLPTESGKFERLSALADEIAQRQEKMLVFTQFESMTAPLEQFLSGIFGARGLVLHGGIPVGKRRGLVDAFQSPDGPPFFVLSLKAGGTGLTLTAANHVVHFDRWWNPAVENQATDRAFRIGQKKTVMVHALVCQGTLEERIDEMLEEKSALAEEVLSEGGAPKRLTEMSNDELLSFVRLDLKSAAL